MRHFYSKHTLIMIHRVGPLCGKSILNKLFAKFNKIENIFFILHIDSIYLFIYIFIYMLPPKHISISFFITFSPFK